MRSHRLSPFALWLNLLLLGCLLATLLLGFALVLVSRNAPEGQSVGRHDRQRLESVVMTI